MSSPTERTLKLLREEGWTAQVTEKWNPHSRTRLDLFNGIDVLACKVEGPVVRYENISSDPAVTHMSPVLIREGGIVGVQACAGSSHANRKAKLLSEKKMAIWLAAGGRLAVWSWSKKGARGARKLWTVRREELRLADFIPEREP